MYQLPSLFWVVFVPSGLVVVVIPLSCQAVITVPSGFVVVIGFVPIGAQQSNVPSGFIIFW